MRKKRRKILFAIVIVMCLYAGKFKDAKIVNAATISPVFRLYNDNTGEHFYTMSEGEYKQLQTVGWKDEGIGWFTQSGVGDPVYRVYNPNAKGGDHYYTMSKGEAQWLVGLGWRWDNDGKPAFYSNGNVPLYVEYNPNAESGAHNYTTSAGENDYLLSIGWLEGNVAWYVQQPGTSYVAKAYADRDVTGYGGSETAIPGSYRLIYSDRSFDPGDFSNEVPAIDFSADVCISGSTDDYEMQFIIAGTSESDGQIGLGLHYQAGNDNRFGQGRINVTTINFPADAGIYGNQYYVVNTGAPYITPGNPVRVRVKYYESGYMQTYVNDALCGQFMTALDHHPEFILHFNANTGCTVSNICVMKNGENISFDKTKANLPFENKTYDITNGVAAAIY